MKRKTVPYTASSHSCGSASAGTVPEEEVTQRYGVHQILAANETFCYRARYGSSHLWVTSCACVLLSPQCGGFTQTCKKDLNRGRGSRLFQGRDLYAWAPIVCERRGFYVLHRYHTCHICIDNTIRHDGSPTLHSPVVSSILAVLIFYIARALL